MRDPSAVPVQLRRPLGPSWSSVFVAVTFAVVALAALVAPGVAGIDTGLGGGVVQAAAGRSNSLNESIPATGSSLDASPEAIVLAFDQELAVDDVLNFAFVCNNAPGPPLESPAVDADRVRVTVALTSPTPRGACVFTWWLLSADGQEIATDIITFSVTSDPPATTVPSTEGATTTTPVEGVAATPTPEVPTDADTTEPAGSSGGAIWLGRLMSTLGILVVFGGLALISVGWPEGPEYVVAVRFLRSSWALSLVGTILYVVALTADTTAASFSSAFNPLTWLDLVDGGWTGRGALLRLIFVVATGWVARRPERIIDPVSAMWAWALPGVALLAVAMSRVAGSLALLGYLVNVVHVIAVAIWIGGAALVARVVLAGPGEDDLVQATRAFSRVSVPAMLIAAVTGVIQVVRLDGGDLFTSGHGRVVLLKVVAVAAMLAVAIAARQQVAYRLDRAHEMTAVMADRFQRAFQAEAMLGVVVLAFSGWLLSLTPPSVDPLGDEVYITEAIPVSDPGSGLEARIWIGPGQEGPTGLRVEVDAPAEGISNLRLRFISPDPNAFIIEQPIPLNGAGTAVLATQDGLPLNSAGQWRLQVFAATATGVLDGAERTFLLSDVDGNYPSTTIGAATNPSVAVEVVEPTEDTANFATTTTTTPPASSG